MSRIELEGMQGRLRRERLDLATRAGAKITAIKHLLSLASITPVEEIDLEGVHALAGELCEIKAQLTANTEKTKKVERELNG